MRNKVGLKPFEKVDVFSTTKEPIATRFVVDRDRAERARLKANVGFLTSTLFVIPVNDGEAQRALQILRALGAPFVHVSAQGWGAVLDKESLSDEVLSQVENVLIMEIPGLIQEHALRQLGKNVVLVDHHQYSDVDRRHPLSSLEQLCEKVSWTMDETDLHIAVNDRSYVAGLKEELGLSEVEIREVRYFDLQAQGNKLAKIIKSVQNAQTMLPRLARVGDIYIFQGLGEAYNILKQELAMASPTGSADSLEFSRSKLGFSGNPAIVKKLLEMDFTQLGYDAGTYSQYGGGDGKHSMFFGFRPQKGPLPERESKSDLIPERINQAVLDKIKEWVTTKVSV